jgi:hypothetical protein
MTKHRGIQTEGLPVPLLAEPVVYDGDVHHLKTMWRVISGDDSKLMSSLYFELHLFCLFKPRHPEFGVVYTSRATPVFQKERFSVRFVSL